MGAEIQFKNYIPLHNVTRIKDEHPSSSWSWFHNDYLLSDHLHDDSFLTETNGYSQCDKEMIKRLMLEHEATFTMQVSELHRLYRIQKELMIELKFKEQQKLCSTFQPNLFASHMLSEVSEEFQQMPHTSALNCHPTSYNPVEFPLQDFKGSGTGCFLIPIKTEGSSVVEVDFLNLKTGSLPRRKFDLHLPAEIYIDADDEVISEKQKKPCLRVANVSRKTQNAHGGDNELYLSSKTDGSVNESSRPGIISEDISSRMVITDLNEPLEPSNFVEGDGLTSEVIGETNEHAIMAHHRQSDRSLLSREHFLENYCQIHIDDLGECSQGWPSSTNSSGDQRSTANGSQRGICDEEFSIISQCGEQKSKKCDRFVLPDQENSTKLIGENPNPSTETSKDISMLPNSDGSELATTQLSYPFANLPHSENFGISSQPALSQRISNGEEEMKLRSQHELTLGSSANVENLGFPVSETSNVDFRGVNMYSSASSMIAGEETIELDCDLTNAKATENKEDGSYEAAENIVAMSLLIDDHPRDDTIPSTPTSWDALYWFSDFVAATELGTGISREKAPVFDNGDDVCLDLFECMTLEMKEVENKFICKPQEIQKHADWHTASPLLARSGRGLLRKRRQRRDFQKDILPGIASLSRNQVTEDIQSFECIMRASGKSWKAASSRSARWKGEDCRGRERRRPSSLPISVAETNLSSPKQDASLAGILSWGRTTRRCRRQKILPGTSSPLNQPS